jgi:hypothetical protein
MNALKIYFIIVLAAEVICYIIVIPEFITEIRKGNKRSLYLLINLTCLTVISLLYLKASL